MNEPLVSIIVPVYNVESYLSPCLESIQRQSWRNLEVLMVDDGSTDGSSAVCADMAVADPRFRLLRQENAGVSAARNAALTLAGGKYLQFVDGDDRIHPQATETLVHAAEAMGADLVLSHFYRVDGERQAVRGHIKGERLLTRQEFASILAKALPSSALPSVNDVPDGSIPDVYKSDKGIYQLYRAGVLSGNDDAGTFRPNAPITRAEVASVLVRMADPNTRILFSLD